MGRRRPSNATPAFTINPVNVQGPLLSNKHTHAQHVVLATEGPSLAPHPGPYSHHSWLPQHFLCSPLWPSAAPPLASAFLLFLAKHSCTSQGQQHSWHLPKTSPALRRWKIEHRRGRVPSLFPAMPPLSQRTFSGPPLGSWAGLTLQLAEGCGGLVISPSTKPKPTEQPENIGNCIFLYLIFSKYLLSPWLVWVLCWGTNEGSSERKEQSNTKP